MCPSPSCINLSSQFNYNFAPSVITYNQLTTMAIKALDDMLNQLSGAGEKEQEGFSEITPDEAEELAGGLANGKNTGCPVYNTGCPQG